MSEEKKDFVVKDSRVFSKDNPEDATQEAAGKADASSADETRTAATEAGSRQTEKQATSETDEPEKMPPPLPKIDFATFVVSLNASALLHLGAIEDPTTGKTSKDLPMAKQTIDILSMLAEKTTGNLSTDEEKLLKNILYDLRIIYVKESG